MGKMDEKDDSKFYRKLLSPACSFLDMLLVGYKNGGVGQTKFSFDPEKIELLLLKNLFYSMFEK